MLLDKDDRKSEPDLDKLIKELENYNYPNTFKQCSIFSNFKPGEI